MDTWSLWRYGSVWCVKSGPDWNWKSQMYGHNAGWPVSSLSLSTVVGMVPSIIDELGYEAYDKEFCSSSSSSSTSITQNPKEIEPWNFIGMYISIITCAMSLFVNNNKSVPQAIHYNGQYILMGILDVSV